MFTFLTNALGVLFINLAIVSALSELGSLKNESHRGFKTKIISATDIFSYVFQKNKQI